MVLRFCLQHETTECMPEAFLCLSCCAGNVHLSKQQLLIKTSNDTAECNTLQSCDCKNPRDHANTCATGSHQIPYCIAQHRNPAHQLPHSMLCLTCRHSRNSKLQHNRRKPPQPQMMTRLMAMPQLSLPARLMRSTACNKSCCSSGRSWPTRRSLRRSCMLLSRQPRTRPNKLSMTATGKFNRPQMQFHPLFSTAHRRGMLPACSRCSCSSLLHTSCLTMHSCASIMLCKLLNGLSGLIMSHCGHIHASHMSVLLCH